MLESSPAENTAVEQTVIPDVNTPSESSTVGTDSGVKNESMLDAVKAALSSAPEASPADDNPGSPEPQAPAEPVQEPIGDLTEEEIKRFGARAQSRIRDLVSERDAVRSRLTELEPKVRVADTVLGFMDKNGLSTQEVDLAFSLAAEMKSNPAEALKKLGLIYRDVASRAGTLLPAELQEEVRLGLITENRARELSETRARADQIARQAESVRQQQEQESLRQEQDRHTNSVLDAVTKWERTQAALDPDWNRKINIIGDRVDLAIRTANKIVSPQEAVQIAEKVRNSVNEELKQFLPPPRPVSRDPVSRSSSTSRPEPRNMLEAIKGALGS
jgi:hypothetical protein